MVAKAFGDLGIDELGPRRGGMRRHHRRGDLVERIVDEMPSGEPRGVDQRWSVDLQVRVGPPPWPATHLTSDAAECLRGRTHDVGPAPRLSRRRFACCRGRSRIGSFDVWPYAPAGELLSEGWPARAGDSRSQHDHLPYAVPAAVFGQCSGDSAGGGGRPACAPRKGRSAGPCGPDGRCGGRVGCA